MAPCSAPRLSGYWVNSGTGDTPGGGVYSRLGRTTAAGVGGGYITDHHRQKRGFAHTTSSKTVPHGRQTPVLRCGGRPGAPSQGRASKWTVKWLIPSHESFRAAEERTQWAWLRGRAFWGRGLVGAGPGAEQSLLVKRLLPSPKHPERRAVCPQPDQVRIGEQGEGGSG